MSVVKKYILSNSAVVAVADSKGILDKAAELHSLSLLSSVVLNRILTVGVFFGQDLKNGDDGLLITVSGEKFARAVVSVTRRGAVKGYIENTVLGFSKKDGDVKDGGQDATLDFSGKEGGGGGYRIEVESDVKATVGRNGFVETTKSIGGRLYSGRSELAEGDITSDFALYLAVSEQKNSYIALGEFVSGQKKSPTVRDGFADGGEVLAAGGCFLQFLPDAEGEFVRDVRGVFSRLSDFGRILYELKTPDAVMRTYFNNFTVEPLDEYEPRFYCGCSEERTRKIVALMGRKEAFDTLKERGAVEARCDFCGKTYVYGKKEIEKIFGK
ncbi:MAG: Hsp33 family molecular chaperone HslO [Clostridiales bacterium]|jgi:molecular chaperone Hsp33|nr:Hsp33 family molecular chaperone HslO [Clostridiales bacterium]